MDQASMLRELMKNKDEKNKFKVITVSSGKGGVGKTNFVVNLASALTNKGLRVAILDADFGMANVDIVYGVKCKYSIYDVLYNNLKLDDIISYSKDGVRIIPGGSGIKELSELDDEKRKMLISSFASIKNVDILIVDTGAGMSNNVTNFVEIADELIVLTNSEPTALTDAYSLIKVLTRNKEITNIGIVVNRAYSMREANETFDKLNTTAEVFLNVKLNYLGYIVEDSKVGLAVREQIPFYISFPKSQASLCIQGIASKIIGEKQNLKNKSVKEYFSKLLSLMGR